MSIVNWFWGPSAAEQEQARMDTAALIALTEQSAARGVISGDEAQKRINLITGSYEDQFSGKIPALNPDIQFNLGLSEGWENVKSVPQAILNETGKTIWQVVPWWVWAAGGLALFIYIYPLLLAVASRKGS